MDLDAFVLVANLKFLSRNSLLELNSKTTVTIDVSVQQETLITITTIVKILVHFVCWMTFTIFTGSRSFGRDSP
jgi:hypothetical protein